MGLKSLFPAFMKSSVICLSKTKVHLTLWSRGHQCSVLIWVCDEQEAKSSSKEDDEHVISIVSSLLLRLSGEPHARLLNKFVENDFEKVDRLMELHDKYMKRVKEAGDEDEEDEDEDDGLTPEERRLFASHFYYGRLDVPSPQSHIGFTSLPACLTAALPKARSLVTFVAFADE